MFDKLSLSTQVDVHSPSPLNFPVSKCYAQLPSPNVAAETQLLPFVQRCACSGCSSWLSFITVIIQANASWLSEKLSCTKILLTSHMRPTAIALNFSVKNIRNDVCQIIIYIYEKSQFNSLVWGSLTFTPIIFPIGR